MAYIECGGIPTFYLDSEDYFDEFDDWYTELKSKEQTKLNILCLFFLCKLYPLLFDDDNNESIKELYYNQFYDELYVPDPMMGNYTTDDF